MDKFYQYPNQRSQNYDFYSNKSNNLSPDMSDREE